jgi:hypothetical protein
MVVLIMDDLEVSLYKLSYGTIVYSLIKKMQFYKFTFVPTNIYRANGGTMVPSFGRSRVGYGRNQSIDWFRLGIGPIRFGSGSADPA